MDKIIPAFEESLFEHPIDIGKELVEVGIDSVLDEGVLQSLPIAGIFVSGGKLIMNIHDRNLLRQTAAFINEFNSREIDIRKLEKYRNKIKNKPQYAEAELGRVLILIDRNVDMIKSKYQGRFFAAYVNEEISWEEFKELSDITDRLFVSDLIILKEAYVNNGVNQNMRISYKHDRLISNGLLINEARLSGQLIMVTDNEPSMLMELTEIGHIFCKYVFES